MRNLKKFLALVLAMLMVVSAGATVSAYSDVAEDDAYAAAIAALTEYGIVNGTELGEAEDGSDALFEPDADVTRWQMALMMARALAPEVTNEEWAEGMEIFADVDQWYGAIAYAYVEGIVNGVSTESLVFKPNDGIKYQDGLIMALRALGYDVDVSGVVYWLDAWTQAKQIGLTDDIAISSGSKTMTRGEMAQLIYNMVQLPFADGSESLAIKYYGSEAPIGDYDTYVVTATPKQAYVKGQHTDATLPEGETAAALLGLQKLEAGIPAGDIIYIPAAKLGIADADADACLHYAVNLYDYDAQYNEFSAYEFVADPVVVRGTAISESGSTIKVNGYTYYLVDSLTDAARRNEIVVFTGDADKKDSLVLIKNKDGDILDFDGKIVATYVYTLGSTNYYVDENVDGNPVVISEAAALKEYGVKTADDAVFTEYETLDAVADSTPYQLSLFDDNGDGKYDRAIYSKVYMAVYNEVKDEIQKTLGPWTDSTDDTDKKGITFTDTTVQTKGTIFTYTYNPQLKVVNVLEVLEKQSGVVENVAFKDKKVTIDGTTYIIGETAKEDKIGADVKVSGTDAAGARKWSEIAKGALYYTTHDNFYAIGNTYEFYAYNGYILNGNKINPVDEDANWKYFVTDGAVSYDSTAVYVDGYVANGEKATIEIAVIDSNVDLTEVGLTNLVKDTAINSMNIFDLGEFLAEAKELFAKGNLFKVVPREDGTYRLLTDNFEGAVAPIKATVGGVDVYTYKNFDLKAAIAGNYVFYDDRTDAIVDKKDRVRTNDNTVFYFVEYDTVGGKITDLDIHRGTPKDEWSINVQNVANGVYMFADKIGYGTSTENAYNGTASTVVVYYTQRAEDANAINGFNITSVDVDYSIVYVTAFANDAISIVPASQVEENSAVNFYYKSTGKNAINMATGEVITNVYAPLPVQTAGYYRMDKNNILISAAAAEDTVTLDITAGSYDLSDEYYKLPGIANTGANNAEITTLYTTLKTSGAIDDVKTSVDDNDDRVVHNTTTNKANTITYVAAKYREEGKLVAVVTKDVDRTPSTPSTPTTPAGIAGKWNTNGIAETAGVVYANGLADGKIENVKFTVTWNGAADTFASVDAVDNVLIAKDTADNIVYAQKGATSADAYKDYAVTKAEFNADKSEITLTLGITLLDGTVKAMELESGLYMITLGFVENAAAAGAQKTITVIFTVA